MTVYRLSIAMCVALCLCSSVFADTPASTENKQTSEVPWDVLDGGGGVMCSESYSVGGSLGQIAPGVSVVEFKILSAGYWAGIDSLPSCGPAFACGDCNGDGRITVADATYLVSYIYRGGSAPIGSGDVNLDTRVTVADATYIVSYIYRGGPEPCNPPARYTPVRTQRRVIER